MGTRGTTQIALGIGVLIGLATTWTVMESREPAQVALASDDRLLLEIRDLLKVLVARQELPGDAGSAAIDLEDSEPAPAGPEVGLSIERRSTEEVVKPDREQAREILRDIVAELAAFRDQLRAERMATERGPSLRALLARRPSPNWDEVQRFLEGCEADREAWNQRAHQELALMTRAEVLERFGAPTNYEASSWGWLWQESMPHFSLGISFQEGMVSVVDGDIDQ